MRISWLVPSCLAVGGAAWWFLGSAAGHMQPFDNPHYWTFMLVLGGLCGFHAKRHAWLAGAALVAPHAAGMITAAWMDGARHWIAGLGAFTIFALLVIVLAEGFCLLGSMVLPARPQQPSQDA